MTSSYFHRIWDARYFWIYLALSDLRARWRGSFLGVFWSILHPLGMTLLLTFVLGRFFRAEVRTYAPYILSGFVTWEFIVSCCTNGAMSFIQSAVYIHQVRYPLAIYTMRTVLTALIIMTLASLTLYGWVLWAMPQNFGWCWLSLLLFYPLLLLTTWPVATIFAHIGVRFRDLPYALGLLLQAVWFASPVYFEAQMFRKSGMGFLVDINPLYHFLQLIRAPLLEGTWPTMTNYFFALGTMGILFLIAVVITKKSERGVVFYL